MNTLQTWAARWGIPQAALDDLRVDLTRLADGGLETVAGESEAAVQTKVRIEASRAGVRLFRNNVGAGYLQDGSFIRWGLANDSAQMNAIVKSGDLVGIRPRVIGFDDVGKTIGQFVSREVKHGGWKWAGTEREVAQASWANLVNSLGGDACFASGTGTI